MKGNNQVSTYLGAGGKKEVLYYPEVFPHSILLSVVPVDIHGSTNTKMVSIIY